MSGRLYRSEADRMLGGVCGGLAAYLDVDPVFARLAFILLAFANGIGVIAYVALWLVMPRQSQVEAAGREVFRDNFADIQSRASEVGQGVRSAFGGPRVARDGGGRPVLVAALLIVAGALLLMGNLNIYWWFAFGKVWPAILIVAGIVLLVLGRRS